MAAQKQDDQHEHTFSSYVRIQDVVLKTYLGQWTIGRSGERGSGISVLPARYDDDDDNMPNPFFIHINSSTSNKIVWHKKTFKYYLTHTLYPIRCYHSESEHWQWKDTPHFPKLQYYWGLTIRLFSVISRTLTEGVTHLQWCSCRILQLLLTGPYSSTRMVLALNNLPHLIFH